MKDLNKHLMIKDIQLAGKYMKRYSASHSIKEFQIKITMRYHYTFNRITKLYHMMKPNVEQEELLFIAGGNAKWCSHTGRHCSSFFFFLAKLNILLPYKPAVISLGVYPNERNLYSPKAAWDILATLIITAQTRK